MTTISDPRLIPGGQTITRTFDFGTLKFEDYAAGTWLTKAGAPGKTARRHYLLDGEEVYSVSSIVGCLDKPALVRWIEDQATRGAVQAERLGELAGVPEEDWCRRVRSLNLGASAKRDEGADRGTIVHDALHTLAVEGRAPNPADVPGIARPWVRGAVAAWLSLGDGDVIAAEEIVCHPELRYAGRFDLLRMLVGQRTLLDWKSGRGKIFEAAHWQARLYAMALERCGEPVDRIVLVGIGDDGGFELVDCACTEQDAEALLRVHRAQKRIQSDMRAQRAIARAAS